MNQQHIGLMFSMVITPMIFFGCTYYPWSALNTFPILQKIVLINPLVYASEGLRAALVPQYPHLSAIAVLIALTVFDLLLLLAGLHQFQKQIDQLIFPKLKSGIRGSSHRIMNWNGADERT